jgi:hypothetical protein
MQVQVHALGVEFLQHRQQIRQRSAQAIDWPCGHHVNFTPGHRLQQLVETRALITPLSTADAVVAINGCNIPTMTLGDGLQLAFLVADGLAICGAGPNVKGNPLWYLSLRVHGVDPIRVKPDRTINIWLWYSKTEV